MSGTPKQNNHHKVRPIICRECERDLPKRAHRDRCATCIKGPRCRHCRQVIVPSTALVHYRDTGMLCDTCLADELGIKTEQDGAA